MLRWYLVIRYYFLGVTVMYNKNLYNLEKGNGFSDVIKRINEFKKNNPDINIISLGIGDVSKPIVKPILDAMHKAVDELGDMSTFKGYCSYYGIEELRQTILDNEYKKYDFSVDEIYISNGTKTDSSSILELFDINAKIYISNPGYTVYRDGALSINRNPIENILTEETDFIPEIPKEKYDLIYLCSPNNPIGNAYSYEDLQKWVDYAIKNNSIILFDNVYFPFIRDKNIPLSIYEIKGAKDVAIEFRSFSKAASFTGLRCSYYVIPKKIDKDNLWKKRTMNRTNGVAYIVQKGAIASYEKEAQFELKNNIEYYLENAKKLRKAFENNSQKVWGGDNSPFMWVKTCNNMSSWDYFDFMLKELNIIIIPGVIFGEHGEGYFRVSALGNSKDIDKAIERISNYEK